MKKIAIGIDIGGTNTAYGLVSQDGICFAENSIPTKGYEDVNHYIQVLTDNVNALIKKQNEEFKVEGIGIGAPNGNFHNGTIEFAPNLEWEGIIPLADLVQKKFNLPTWLTNDANAGALGEKLYGGGKNINIRLSFTIGGYCFIRVKTCDNYILQRFRSR